MHLTAARRRARRVQLIILAALSALALYKLFLYRYLSDKEEPFPHTPARFCTTNSSYVADWASQALAELQANTPVTAKHLKVLGIIFPQYHAIPENDRFWGVNFTEWVNVKKASKNKYGMELPQPAWGYYNLLEFDVRKRLGDFLREAGIYGVVMHHYWFAGQPIMDSIPKKMIEDGGEPNLPFFFNWANEPWTKRWDGMDKGGVLMAQDYGGEAEWRLHFDYLLPFFRHPKYIKVGGRPVFAVYKVAHMKREFGPMTAKFKQWAEEAGFPPGGMEIMQANWRSDPVHESADSIYDYQPHAGGFEAADIGTPRRHKIHHRGAMVSWDNTARHLTDGKAVGYMGSHPSRWYYQLVDLIQRVVVDPNPMQKENFIFINAINEWGEGDVLEPTKLQGDGYAKALKAALHFSRASDSSTARDAQAKLDPVELRAETCVLVRTYHAHNDQAIFSLNGLIKSLRGLHNPNWVAVIFPTDTSGTSHWAGTEKRFNDTRIKFHYPPNKVRLKYTRQDAGFSATDYMVKHLSEIDSKCAGARWMVITNGDNVYRADALSYLDSSHDLIGLSFVSRWISHNEDQKGTVAWNERCERLTTKDHCFRSSPFVGKIDLGAMIINWPKFRATKYRFSSFTASDPLAQDGKMAELLVTQGFRFGNVPQDQPGCQLLHNPSYAACRGMGQVWFDSPIFSDADCITSGDVDRLFTELPAGTLDVDYTLVNGHCIRYSKRRYKELVEALE
ncbi:hypothetical protein HDU87_006881 [Geranomyces variabilis]|uniref:Uncharacterized protein n=1 Tax=Geranomyces variabilis TaxID=109894 RepID=A0AAD5TF81_9FUNG|nr:hypothetical protein HDU87_006881 [Geranomyces variabilis]